VVSEIFLQQWLTRVMQWICGLLTEILILFQRAFKSLCTSTHLYGRRLVLEWADDTESIDELRKKTADYFHERILDIDYLHGLVQLMCGDCDCCGVIGGVLMGVTINDGEWW
jgi:hypothetical protein